MLKDQQDKLNKSKIEIERTEKENLTTIAATYDVMDPISASKILINMSKAPDGSGNDAVKILHYMGDRAKAKLLAEVANAEPMIAAYFSQRLKQMVEQK